MIIQII